ncbi:hypothetical protein MPH_04217 [Macrophomina phaseolina MS6]|uniref:Uncharacterized protein n=1 Tax=Macrophomina phaseolina (strain MS6) TaxID=1126212 RepID=K2SNQ7_MACPH|nr:hypothetical protein MPH_04217 [Macrophomina phaseolina MS6]
MGNASGGLEGYRRHKAASDAVMSGRPCFRGGVERARLLRGAQSSLLPLGIHFCSTFSAPPAATQHLLHCHPLVLPSSCAIMKAPFHPVFFLPLVLLLGGFVAAFRIIHVPLPPAFSWRNRPTLFTPETSCRRWLRQNDRAILYPYGRNITANGAEALAQCLDSHDAAAHLHKFTDIFVVFPRAGPPEDTQPHLQKIVESLPGPLTVR